MGGVRVPILFWKSLTNELLTLLKMILEVWIPRTLQNNVWLLKFCWSRAIVGLGSDKNNFFINVYFCILLYNACSCWVACIWLLSSWSKYESRLTQSLKSGKAENTSLNGPLCQPVLQKVYSWWTLYEARKGCIFWKTSFNSHLLFDYLWNENCRIF